MNNFLLIIYILADLLYILIILHIIFSWIDIFWFHIKSKFIDSILDPIYDRIKNTIPTNIWVLDFSPLILILILAFIQNLIFLYNPETIIIYKNLTNFF